MDVSKLAKELLGGYEAGLFVRPAWFSTHVGPNSRTEFATILAVANSDLQTTLAQCRAANSQLTTQIIKLLFITVAPVKVGILGALILHFDLA